MKKTLAGAVVATAVAGLFLSGALKQVRAEDKPAGKVKCSGTNECSGKGACKSAGNECAGKNGCKGKGWVFVTSEEECKTKGGTVVQ